METTTPARIEWPDLTPENYPPFDGTPRAGHVGTTGRGLLRRHVGGGWIMPDRWRIGLMRRLAKADRVPDITRLLLESAELVPEDLRIHELTRKRTSELVAEHGLDRATAILHHLARRDPSNAEALREFERWTPMLGSVERPRLRGRLVIIPAAFYEELPEFGGDGHAFLEAARACGLDARLFALPGMSPLEIGADFAAHLVRELHAEDPDTPVVIVTLSRGGAELRRAFEREELELPTHVTWVNVCGLIRGSEHNRELAAGRTRKVRSARRKLHWIGVPPQSFPDYVNGPPGVLAPEPRIPDAIDVVNIVPLPLTSTVSSMLRKRHARIGEAGPNDGITLTCDSILPRGLVVPILHADHYLRTHEATLTVWRTLAWLARPGSQHAA